MKFGTFEIFEYEKTCTDPKVLIIIKHLHESRSNAARWCDAHVRVQKENKELKETAIVLYEALETLERVAGTGMPKDDPARVAARKAITKVIGENNDKI